MVVHALTPDEGKQLSKQLVKLVDAHLEVVMKAFRKFAKFQDNSPHFSRFLFMGCTHHCLVTTSGADKTSVIRRSKILRF